MSRGGRVAETEGGSIVNGLLMEEAPTADTACARACSLDHYLVMPDETMDARIAAAREKLGADAIILGHHYQRDEVIRFADFTGDSYKLSQGRGGDGREVHGLLRRAFYGGDGGHTGAADGSRWCCRT